MLKKVTDSFIILIWVLPNTENVGEHAVSQDCLTEFQAFLCFEVYQSMADGHKGVRPGQGLVLVPPPLHNVAYIKTKQKCHLFGHSIEVLLKIVDDSVKLEFLVLFPLHQPVEAMDDIVESKVKYQLQSNMGWQRSAPPLSPS